MYSIRNARAYFNLFGSLLVFPNLIDRPVYSRRIDRGRLHEARAILELGSGTGSFAKRLISSVEILTMLEVSDVNLALLRWRFRADRQRAQVLRVSRPPPFDLPPGSYDRFVSCFVLEILDPASRSAHVAEAYRLLRPGGLVCIMALTRCSTRISRLMIGLGQRLSRINRWLALGAQICDLEPLFDQAIWQIRTQETVCCAGFATRLLVIEKLEPNSTHAS